VTREVRRFYFILTCDVRFDNVLQLRGFCCACATHGCLRWLRPVWCIDAAKPPLYATLNHGISSPPNTLGRLSPEVRRRDDRSSVKCDTLRESYNYDRQLTSNRYNQSSQSTGILWRRLQCERISSTFEICID